MATETLMDWILTSIVVLMAVEIVFILMGTAIEKILDVRTLEWFKKRRKKHEKD